MHKCKKQIQKIKITEILCAIVNLFFTALKLIPTYITNTKLISAVPRNYTTNCRITNTQVVLDALYILAGLCKSQYR